MFNNSHSFSLPQMFSSCRKATKNSNTTSKKTRLTRRSVTCNLVSIYFADPPFFRSAFCGPDGRRLWFSLTWGHGVPSLMNVVTRVFLRIGSVSRKIMSYFVVKKPSQINFFQMEREDLRLDRVSWLQKKCFQKAPQLCGFTLPYYLSKYLNNLDVFPLFIFGN